MRHCVIESGSVITAAVGDEVIVHLTELAASGYEWQLPETLPDGLEEFEVEQLPADTNAIGGANPRYFGFRVTSPGRYIVCLWEYRSWEGLSKAIGSFTFEVNSLPKDGSTI